MNIRSKRGMPRYNLQSSPNKRSMRSVNARNKGGNNFTLRIALLGCVALMIHYAIFRDSLSSSDKSLSSTNVKQQHDKKPDDSEAKVESSYYSDEISSNDTKPKASIDTKNSNDKNEPSKDEATSKVESKLAPLTSETLDLEMKRPKVAWLMSFPNSGTSYTLSVVRRSTQTTTATNYGREKMYDESSVPYHPLHPDGPFLHKIDMKVPDSYILTKTHCGGYCSNCAPRLYITSKEDFQTACLSGRSEDKDGNREPVSYDIDLIKKAVYLIRNPFDNIVSRFHLTHNEKVKKEKKGDDDASDWLNEHPRDKDGFQKWCQNTDLKYETEEKEAFPLVLQYPGILCQSEIIKYIQWHNLAAEILEDNEIPIHIIHYEDYKHNFDESLGGTLDFLQLPNVGELKDFHLSDYSNYFSKDERAPSIMLMRELASTSTLEKITRYINPSSEEKASDRV